MNKSLNIICIIVVLFCSCTGKNNTAGNTLIQSNDSIKINKTVSTDSTKNKQKKAVYVERNGEEYESQEHYFSSHIYKQNDTITILLPEHFPPHMAIMDPKGVFYFIYNPDYDTVKNPYLFLEKDGYKIKLPTNVNGTYNNDGNDVTKGVFSATGKYKIVLSDNLETEWDNAFCVFYNIHFKK